MTHPKDLMYKKGVVLLITLFFIMAITAIIAKNLKSTDEFIDEVAISSSLTQLHFTIENVNNQIAQIIKQINDKGILDEILSSLDTIPLNYGNVKILLDMEQYDATSYYNLNDVNLSKKTDELFQQNVLSQYDFFEVYLKKYKKEYGEFKNKRQISYFIEEYQKNTKDDTIFNIKDKFTHIHSDLNTTYISCDYLIDVQNIKSQVNMVFTADGKVVNMDISFKQ